MSGQPATATAFKSESSIGLADFIFALGATFALLLIAGLILYIFRDSMKRTMRSQPLSKFFNAKQASQPVTNVTIRWRKRLSPRTQVFSIEADNRMYVITESQGAQASVLDITDASQGSDADSLNCTYPTELEKGL